MLAIAKVSCGLLLAACGQKIAIADETPPTVSSEPTPAASKPRPPAIADALAESEADQEDDTKLRRGYGAIDMRLNPCVTRANDRALQGAGCRSGFVIFGPYVEVPSGSEIEVSFEIKASERVEVYADIVSRMATQSLAGLNRLAIEAGVNQKLGYRVHVFNADAQVESRIGLSAEPGANFEITNLTMTVR
jgi:hypothetical protein